MLLAVAIATALPLASVGITITARCADPTDCTDSLQAALNATGADLIIIPRQASGNPWFVRPMLIANETASHRTIHLQERVEIRALGDGSGRPFHWPFSTPLLTITNASNITLQGSRGATIRMNRATYNNPSIYNKG